MYPAETLNNNESGRLPGHFKRNNRRAEIQGFTGNLVDGNKIIGGIVENISSGGFQLSNLPESFSAEKHTYWAVISGKIKHYKVLVKPCWRNNRAKNDIVIGFKILDAPWQWTEFTLNLIPEERLLVSYS
jgi:hypothetical protein